MNFIKLTHFSTGNVTYLKSEDITSVSQGFDRTLIICTNGQGAHYREGAEYIMDLIHGETYPPAVEYGEPTQADFEMGHVAGVCDLGPLITVEPKKVVYTVTADYNLDHGNEFKHKVFKDLADARDYYHDLYYEFKKNVGTFDYDDCDFENENDDIPTVYLVDTDHENFVRITVEELTVE
jgi:hypothetical protein